MPACRAADWTFRRATGSLQPCEHLGVDSVDATIRVRCGRIPGGFRLEFDDTGIFDIVAGGRDITWTPGADAPLELVRADLLGGVFSVALHLHGLMCLHGSAVAIGDVVVAFLANKGGGKSTLATALCAAGATLVTDDMLPVDPRDKTAWPSMPAVRLLQDSAAHLRHANGQRHPATNKYHVQALPDAQVERRRLPLVGIYELAPVASGADGPAAQRIRVAGPAAVGTLLRHNRTGTAIGGAESTNLFLRASDIVRAVPVHRLEVARDFHRLPEVVSEIFAWHSSPAQTTESSAARTSP